MLKPLLFILLVGIWGIVHAFDLTTMKLKSKSFSKMEKQGVVPDVVDVVPRSVVKLTYKSGVSANLGNVLTPTQVKDMPNVAYEAYSSKLYTLVMTDPDAPSRANPTDREFHHWLVGNIRGNNLTSGETLSEYIGSGPPQGSGLHRYIFLVFKQKSKLSFTEKVISNRSGENREKFSVRKFATKYCLGNPVAGNFYQAEWDDYVPILYEQLGGN